MYIYIKHYVDKNSINSSSSYILNKQCSSPLEMQSSRLVHPTINTSWLQLFDTKSEIQVLIYDQFLYQFFIPIFYTRCSMSIIFKIISQYVVPEIDNKQFGSVF